MIGITEFYKKALPSQGVYCIATIEPNKDARTRHYYVESIAELEPKIEELKPLGTNIYVSHSTYKGYKRAKDNAVYSKAFFVDLDVDPQEDVPDEEKNNKKYISKEEAEAALDAFVVEFNLPPPVKLDSGRGIWAWWAFDRDIPISEWNLYAEVFKKYCLDNGLKIDPNVTADSARVTRTPNCTNWKANPPTETKVLSNELPIYVFDEFKEFLDTISPVDLSIEAILKAAKKGLSQEEREAQGGNLYENNFAQLLDESVRGIGCQQIKYAYENQDKVDYDLWTACLTVASRCVDAETAIHTMSEKAPSYDRQATILKAATFGGVHPCTSFENANPDGCEGCIKRGAISNPLYFGRRLRTIPIMPAVIESQVEDGQEVEEKLVVEVGSTEIMLDDNDDFTYPPQMLPFFSVPGKGIFMDMPGKFDIKTGEVIKVPPIQICEVDLKAKKKVTTYSEDGPGDSLLIRARFPHDDPIEFMFPLAHAYSTEKLMEAFARKSITVERKNVVHFMECIIKWGGYLRNRGRSDIMRTHFGWTDDDKTSFVVGDKEYKRDGTVADNAYSPQTRDYGPLLVPKGTFEMWKNAVSNLNTPGMEVHAFAMLTGFASALVSYTDLNGVTICLAGEAGSGKTGIMFSVNSVWGHPEKLYIKGNSKNSQGGGATVNALQLIMSAMGNLPFTIDEVTNLGIEQVSPLVHMVSSGKTKIKAQGSSNAIRTIETSSKLMAVFTSNDPLYQKLKEVKADPNGEIARLVEFNIGQPQPLLEDTTFGPRTFGVMLNHHGHAGPMFIQSLFDLESKGEVLRDYNDPQQKLGNRFQKWIDRYVQDAGWDPAERFHHAAIGLCFGAGEICNEYGIFDNLPLEQVYKVIIERMIENKNENARINSIDCESIIGTFILKNIQNMLTIKNKKVYEEPKGSLVIRADNDLNTLFIPRNIFETYLRTEAKVTNINAFIKQLTKSKIDFEIKKTRMTTFWDKVPPSSDWNLKCYCFKNLKLMDSIKDTDE